MTTKAVLRCRAAGTPYNIWARQCNNEAKTTRALDGETLLPVCGIHANARYVYEYRPSGGRYEPPVQTEKRAHQ